MGGSQRAWHPAYGRWAWAGGVTRLLATAPCGRRLRVRRDGRRMAQRFVGCTLLGPALASIIAGIGLPMYRARLRAMAIGWLAVVAR